MSYQRIATFLSAKPESRMLLPLDADTDGLNDDYILEPPFTLKA